MKYKHNKIYITFNKNSIIFFYEKIGICKVEGSGKVVQSSGVSILKLSLSANELSPAMVHNAWPMRKTT